jgi:hypothetical protein
VEGGLSDNLNGIGNIVIDASYIERRRIFRSEKVGLWQTSGEEKAAGKEKALLGGSFTSGRQGRRRSNIGRDSVEARIGWR